jgi:hypothetical protein
MEQSKESFAPSNLTVPQEIPRSQTTGDGISTRYMKYKKNKIFRKTFMKLFPNKRLRIHQQNKSKHFW